MFKKETTYLIVSITEANVSLSHVLLSGQGGKLLSVHREKILPGEEGQMPERVRAAAAMMNARKAVPVLAIPSHMVTTKNIEIPSLDPEEIHSIIDLQAGRHTPYSREEILVGYISIGVFQRNYTKVLLVIVNRDAVKNYLDALALAGLKVDKVLFEPECLAHYYAQILKIQPEQDPIGILDISQEKTDFLVEYNQTVATCRSIPVGIQHIQADPAAKERLVRELMQSLEAYESEDINKLPVRYVVTNRNETILQMLPLLSGALKVSVEAMPFYEFMDASADLRTQLAQNGEDQFSFAAIAAAGCVHDQLQIDLTPQEVKVQRAIEEKGRHLIFFCILGMVLLVLICASVLSNVYFRELYLKKIESEYARKHKQVVALDRIAHRSRIMKDFIQGRMMSLDVVQEIYYLVPKEVYLQTVFMDENGLVNIQGVSESMSRVFDLVKAIEDSPLFKAAKARSTTATKDRGKDAAAFDIVFKLESAPDDKAASAEAAPAAAEEAAPEE